MRLALQGGNGTEILADGSSQNLDGDAGVRRTRFHTPQIDGLEYAAHTAFADELDQIKPAFQHVAHADDRPPGFAWRLGRARENGWILRPVEDTAQNRFVDLAAQGLRQLLRLEHFQERD